MFIAKNRTDASRYVMTCPNHCPIAPQFVSKFRIHRLRVLGMAAEDDFMRAIKNMRIEKADRVKLENIDVLVE